jgi:dual oxidase
MVPGLYLSEEEIDEFIRDLDKNDTGSIDYNVLESKLDEVHEELASDSKGYQSRDYDQRHAFLRSVMGTEETRIPREDFSNTVRDWNVPSLNPAAQTEAYHEFYMKSLPWSRRFWAYWSVQGREVLFIALVVSMQVAFGMWQLVEYLTKPQYRHVGSPRRAQWTITHSLPGIWMGTHPFQSVCRSLVCYLFSSLASFQPSRPDLI